MSAAQQVFIGVGSNLGDREAQLNEAKAALRRAPAISVVRSSGIYETPALIREGASPQPDYLNAVIELSTTLTPLNLLDVLERIEHTAGRPSASKSSWEARTLDLDILAYGDEQWHDERLTIPHLSLANRRFVLAPWAEIAPDFHVTLPFDQSVRDLLCACPDHDEIHRVGDWA